MNKRNTLVGPQLQRGRAGFNPDWKRLIAFLAVIVLGSIVATQVLANSYRFHPALGFNVFHVYPPWSYFLWSHQWEQPSNHSLFAQAFGIGSLVTLGGFMLLLLDVARANSKVNPFLHGSARWADRRDIKAAGLLKNNGVYVGAWRDKNGKIHYLRHAGPEHVLCYAPTRSGKGVGLILPTLLSWQQSVFVTDLKGELYELTSGWRQKYAHNRILRFEPAAAAGSCCFNPMEELRLGTEHEVGDVQNLALIDCRSGWERPKERTITGKRPPTRYWSAAFCICATKAKVEGTPATFGALDHMLADTSRPIQELWNEMLTYAHINGQNHPVVSASARDMLDRPSRGSRFGAIDGQDFPGPLPGSDRRQEHQPVRFSDPGPDALRGSGQPLHHHSAKRQRQVAAACADRGQYDRATAWPIKWSLKMVVQSPPTNTNSWP